jgi:hypothetical protein
MPNVLPNVPYMIPSVLCHVFAVFSCLEKINFKVLQCVSNCHPMCFLTPFTCFSLLPSLSIPQQPHHPKRTLFFLDGEFFHPLSSFNVLIHVAHCPPTSWSPLSFQKQISTSLVIVLSILLTFHCLSLYSEFSHNYNCFLIILSLFLLLYCCSIIFSTFFNIFVLFSTLFEP